MPIGHPLGMLKTIVRGAAAGAAGTAALNAVTYLDMLVRGRPASRTPEQSVQRMAELAGVAVPGDAEQQQNRLTGAGALLGAATGVGVGAAYGWSRAVGWGPSAPVAGACLTVLTIAATSMPMAAMRVSDPRQWDTADWLSDIVPHLAYGFVTAATFAAMYD